MADQNNDNFISIEEAAEYLGVKASTERSWIKNKNMPHYRLGGKLLKFKKQKLMIGLSNCSDR